MLVFIDESGDPGFRIARGSSPIFAVAMVLFERDSDAAETGAVVEALRARLGIKPEFKFNKASDPVRDAFFAAVRSCPFGVRAIVIDKSLIHSGHLRARKERFYNFCVKSMVRFDNGRLVNARVIVDGSGDRAFRDDLKVYLRRQIPAGAIQEVRFKRSHGEPPRPIGRHVRGRHRAQLSHGPPRCESVARDAGAADRRCVGFQMMRPAPYPAERPERAPYGDSSGKRGDFAPPI